MLDKLHVAKQRYEELRDEVRDLGFEEEELESLQGAAGKPKARPQEPEQEDLLKKQAQKTLEQITDVKRWHNTGKAQLEGRVKDN